MWEDAAPPTLGLPLAKFEAINAVIARARTLSVEQAASLIAGGSAYAATHPHRLAEAKVAAMEAARPLGGFATYVWNSGWNAGFVAGGGNDAAHKYLANMVAGTVLAVLVMDAVEPVHFQALTHVWEAEVGACWETPASDPR